MVLTSHDLAHFLHGQQPPVRGARAYIREATQVSTKEHRRRLVTDQQRQQRQQQSRSTCGAGEMYTGDEVVERPAGTYSILHVACPHAIVPVVRVFGRGFGELGNRLYFILDRVLRGRDYTRDYNHCH